MTLNLLPIAMQATAILGCNKEFVYITDTGITINEIGNEIPTQEETTYIGSIQAVSNKLYEQMGLDLSKNYKVVYCPEFLQSIAETHTPGHIRYDGRTWDIIENQNWWETNGFTKCIICENKSLREQTTNDGDNNTVQD